ncbi:MAG TPA: enolase C-terminal domain-like protein [Pyrinomonadaceae bacterium]|jgi:muconate cycloisomerase
MRIKSCTIYALSIPFVEAFAHSAKSRNGSDSIVVRLEASDGAVGYGEGVARRYVTGETVESSIEHIRKVLWPAVALLDYPELMPHSDPLHALAPVDESLPVQAGDGVIAFNAARAAVEVALLDCLLRRQEMSLAEILPARRTSITYGGVISSGSIESYTKRAKQLRLFGIREIKIKIKDKEDVGRVRAVREVVGDAARLRVDANAAFDVQAAIEVAKDLAPFNIAAFEQPIARALGTGALREVRENAPIPIMADESLVTLDDGRALIDAGACDYFNLRVSKCGGIARTLQLARLAEAAGVRLQLGSQVGETAILSAAGRHLAAHLDRIEFVEGSYGKLLLTEDVSRDPVSFGHGGSAQILRGAGLGIHVREDVLEKYARQTIQLNAIY